MLSDDELLEMAGLLAGVDGVVAVSLGGSRARGDHRPDSDVDLGLYYRGPLDVEALRALAQQVTGAPVELTEPGGWGPWVDGGGWLRVRGVPVDWIYRDLDRVRATWDGARAGRHGWHVQPGHPLGFLDVAYAGEVALCRVLADPGGELSALRTAAATYPPALADALVAGLWEARFSVEGARKVVARADTAYVAGCLFRAVLLCAHALHARAGRWLLNEKGAVAAAGRLPNAPAGFGADAHSVLAAVGTTPQAHRAAVEAAADLVERTVAATWTGAPRP